MQQRIGRFQILEEIASGSQGVVYRAFDPDNGQIVAVKVLHPGLTGDRDYVERFRREASLAASIDHPNVVKIFEVAEDDGRQFIAMELLPESLDRVMESAGRLSVDRAATIGAQIAEGLTAAHALGIVHRDIKPKNVLIGPDGTAKVTDFGIARAETLATMTATGAIMGTPHYMSPEQARGERVDARSDVYSLGCILYQMLTGGLPFKGDTPHAVLRQHIDESPEPVRQILRDIPRALADVVERSMEKAPELRYQSASEMATGLRQVVPNRAPQPAPSMPPPSRPTPTPRPRNGNGRSPWLVPTLVALAVAGVGIAIAAIVFSSGGDSSNPAAPQPAAPAAPPPSAPAALLPTTPFPAAPAAVAPAPAAPGSNSILVTVVSSSTKRDWMNQVVEQFNAEAKRTVSGKTIFVEVSHTRSGSSMNDILDGELKPVVWSPGDQSWVALINETWRQQENSLLISQGCQPTVYAPIGFAMWRPMAEALGWPNTPIGWDTIVELAADPNGWSTYGHPEWGQFSFGHSHPAHSNTGMLSMTSFVYGIVGADSPLTGAQVYQPVVEEAMRSLEQNTAKYGRGSTALFDLMVEQGPGYVHAIAASEETTLRFNINSRDELRFPLAFIFPSGGTVWADHPYCILDNADWVSDEQEEAAAIFGDYLQAPEQQALALDNRLRPTDSSIPLRAPFNLDNGTDPRVSLSNAIRLPSPDAVVSAAVIDLFLITKRKATVIIALDVSGSMKGNKIKTATAATAEFLTGLDPDDEVAVLTFSKNVVTLSEPDTVRNVVEGLSRRVRTLTADGSTALYAAVCDAAAMAAELQAVDEARGESRLYGIVLLSDGEDTTGQPTEHQMFTTCLPATAEADGFKIFPIAFGTEANDALLSRLALATGGRLFTADPDSISRVYFTISAEQ